MTRYPAKLFLFGEYSVLLGSSALSMPFNNFTARLTFPIGKKSEMPSAAAESNLQLKRMFLYFMDNERVFGVFLDLQKLCCDIESGLWLESSIPQRYGLGSSGALCAAVYGAYAGSPSSRLLNEAEAIVSCREHFSLMESFFHGRSSGLDPLVSYLNIPLMLKNGGEVVHTELPAGLTKGSNLDVFLIDSGQPCSTGPLVSNFLAEFVPDGVVTAGGNKICEIVNSVIEKLRVDDVAGFWDEINLLSAFQLEYLNHLIPSSILPVWISGLQSGLFTMKLCGSGGGGFLLCFTRQKEAVIRYFNDQHIPVIHVNLNPADE
jgi:mevalonate kinase